MVDVSIIIVTRNTCALTHAAVRSVFESNDTLAKEVVVVDNGSTDETAQVLSRLFPAVKYVRLEKNLGFAGANNLGAGDVKGEFLLLLNSDARLKPESLAQVVDWMRHHVECGVAGVQLLNPDGSPQNSIANFPSLATELLSKSLLRRVFPRRFPGKEHHFTAPVEVESVIGAFMLIRSSLWKALGGFDERYFFFFEETDFCLQARLQGWKVFHLPQVQVWHEQGKSARQVAAPARIEYWRSRYAYFHKNRGGTELFALRCGLLSRLLLNGFVNGLATIATLGMSRRCRQKLAEQQALFIWHLKGCPANMGLQR